MKIVGILLIGLMSGVLAAAVSLGSGGTIWAALLNYIGIGLVASLCAVIVIIWRAYEVERPKARPILGGAAPVSK